MPPSPILSLPVDANPPAPEADQDEMLRAVTNLRTRIKRTPRLTEVLEILRAMGYRRLSPELAAAHDEGRLAAVLPTGGELHARAA